MQLFFFAAVSLLCAALLFILRPTRAFLGTHPLAQAVGAAIYPHPIISCWLLWHWAGLAGIGIFIGFAFFSAVFLFYFSITPVRTDPAAPLRVRLLYGGRRLIYLGLWACAIQAPLCLLPLFFFQVPGVLPNWVPIADAALAVLLSFGLLANGLARVILTSKRLNLVMRLVVIFTLWIPIWGIILMFYCAHKAWEEYDHECYKAERSLERAGGSVCATRYPLVLVHGVGFRDLKYFNYWGRIPRALKKNGAAVYYGNQEAWGTIEANAADLKKAIRRVLDETGSEKVNIIAHSKGGLDARYLISRLGMAESVASLTTISTPHRGSRVIDWLVKMPDRLYRRIAKLVDGNFYRLGDRNPNFYVASRQFTTSFAEQFNRETPDAPGVYYQSYMSVMKGPLSDCFLVVPYCIVRGMVGENDGLVGVESAKWGEFRGVFRNSRRRGISHGDMIDLHRDDYKGFDVVEEYIKLVAELKQKGF